MKYIIFLLLFPFLAFSQSYVGIGTDGQRVEYVTNANVSNNVYSGRIVLNETNSTVISPALKRPYVAVSTIGGITTGRFTLTVPTAGTPTFSSITSSSAIVSTANVNTPPGWETCEVSVNWKLSTDGTFTFNPYASLPSTLTGLLSARTYNVRIRYRHPATGLTGSLSSQANFNTL